MSEAAPQAAAKDERARSGWICRSCCQSVTLTGPSRLPVSLQRAVHTATLKERGSKGHLAAPIEPSFLGAAARGRTGAPP